MFPAIKRYFFAIDHGGSSRSHARENRSVAEANRLQSEQVLRDELDAQWDIFCQSTDPDVRAAALDEIDRINCLLRRT